jgi:hypothetical protein
MTARKARITSLWSLIEGMQKRLEAEGLDHDVVDVAVTRGVEAFLDSPAVESKRRGRFALWLAPPTIAKL